MGAQEFHNFPIPHIVIEYWPQFSHYVVVQLLSLVQFIATPWTGAHRAPLSMGFSGQEY